MGLKVLIAAEHCLLALAQMAECDAKDESEFKVRKLSVQLAELFIGQLLLVLNHLFTLISEFY